MKETDVRIGNLIYEKWNGEQEKREQVVTIAVLAAMKSGKLFAYEGIPVTNKWFTENGWSFEDNGDHGYYIKEVGEWGVFTVDADGSGFQISSFQNTICTKIEFIHELQNFYFTIVGKELVSTTSI